MKKKIGGVEIETTEIERYSQSYGTDVDSVVEIQFKGGRSLKIVAKSPKAKGETKEEFDTLFGVPAKEKK